MLTATNNITVAQDADAPVIAAQLVQDSGSSSTDKITFNPNISGTVLDANTVATFQAAIDSGSFVSILPQRQANGSFTLTRTQLEQVNGGALLDGLHTIKMSAVDEFGNASAVVSIVFTLDTTVLPPNTLKLTSASDTGISATDNITKVNTPTITGLAEPNSTVQLFKGATLLGTATASNTGDWQVTTTALANGTQALTAIATDIAGNISQPSTALSITVDSLLPQLTLATPVAQPLRDTARLTGSLDGTGSALVAATYRFDAGTDIPITFNAAGNFDQAFNFAGITNGAHTLTITSTDTAGNVLTQTYNVTVALDQEAPVITVALVQDSGASTTDAITFNPAITGTVTDLNTVASFWAGFNTTPTANFVDVLPQRQADGSFTLTRAQLETINGGTLPDGAYTLKLQAQDALGNVSAVFNLAFRLDTLAPNAPVLDLPATGDSGVSNTDNITKINPATIVGTAEAGSSVQVFVDGTAATQVTADAQGNWQFNTTTLSEGVHAITAQATDVAGNVSALSSALNITIDTLAPTLTVTTPLETSPLISGARLVGTANGTGSAITTAQYRFDQGSLMPITLNAAGAFDQAIDLTGVANGAHTFTLSLTDTAGNVTTTTYNVTVNQDTTAPIIVVALVQDTGSSQTDKLTNNAAITGTVTDASSIAELLASFSPTGTYANITTALTGSSFTLSPTQLGAINGGTLPDGAYTLYLKAKDSFGNLSAPISFTFTLDTTAPVAPVVDLPASSDSGVSNTDNITKVNPPIIAGTAEIGSQVKVAIDGTTVGTVTSDGTWQITPGALTEGAHTVSAIVTDAAGNVSQTGTLNLQIDSVLPGLTVTTLQNNATLFSNTRLTGQVDGTGSDITQLFYFFDNQVPLPISAAASGNFDLPIDFQNVTNGAHVLNLVTTDRAGNSRALQYTVTVNLDDVAPLLSVDLANDTAPNGTNTDHITYDATVRGQVTDASGIATLTASFSTGPGATFVNILPRVGSDGRFTLNQAVLDNIYGAALPDGQYTLRVVATDIYNNRRETDLSFTLDRVAPRQPGFTLAPNSDTGIVNDGKTQLGTVSLRGLTEAGAYVRSLQQTSITATANPLDTQFIPGQFTLDGIALNLGDNALTLESFDLAGNRSTFTSAITRILDDGSDVVLDWNATTLKAVEFDRSAPPVAAYNMALVHTAVFDAVNAIENGYQRYQIDAPVAAGSSAIAAAAAAAHRILSQLYPRQTATFDAQLAASLAEVANGAAKDQGVTLGRYVADALLAARQNDGSNAVVSYPPGTNPGDWQPTGDSYAGAALPQWPNVRPFGLTTGSQFRPDGPPALNSAEYAAEFNEVKSLGAKTGSTRTADQTQIAQFWSDGNSTYTPPGHWNEIAEAAALKQGNSLLENARLFALLNVSLADAGIAAWDAKYTYDFWRPVTAIQQAATDNNPATTADANWQSLLITPNHPDYVSGHSTFSGAAETILSKFFGETYTFTSSSLGLPGVYRTFTSFDAAAEEAGVSRIYGGIHFRSANQEGLATGRQIGEYIFNQYLRPVVTTGLQAGLARDTAAQGLTNQDAITSDATITGAIAPSAVGSVTIQARFGNTGSFQTVPAQIQADGRFTISPTQLLTILGAALADNSYTLNLRVIDTSNTVLASQAVTFKLDTTAPTVDLQSPIVGAGHSATTRAIGQVLDANGAATTARYSIDGSALQALPVDAQGKFDKRLVATNLSTGNHQLLLETSDVAGNTRQTTVNFTVDANLLASNATNAGWAIQSPSGIVLAEGGSFTTQAAVPIALGQSAGTRTISFNLEKSFDLQDLNAVIQDRLLVYLVNPQNPSQTLLDGGEPGTAVFSLAGQSAEYIPGRVAFNGSTVTIDVSSLGNRTQGALIFQLVNNDGDAKSTVRLSNLTNVVDPNGVSGTIVPPTIQRGSRAGAIADFTDYRPTANAEFLVSNVHLDAATGKYVADLKIRNTGNTPLSRNLAVLFPDLPSGVTLVGASGIHPAGSPYLNLSTLLPPGDLAPGLISPTIQVVFNNPGLAQFDLLPVVLAGQLDRPPSLAALGNLTVQAGSRLEIPLVATDPDGNRVTLSMRPQANLPTGRLQADGRLVFTPSPEQVGTYTFTLVAKSGNLETTQTVNLTVVDDPVTTTRISGSILNTDQAPLAGVVVGVDGWETTTDAMGNFTIALPYLPPDNTLKVYGNRLTGGDVYPFIAEKLPLVLEHEVYQGVNNVISRPIYLPPLDIANGVTIDPNRDMLVSTPTLPGATVSVKAGTLFDKNGQVFTNKLSITTVPTNLTPAALPNTLSPGLVVTIQPGDMVFQTPAPLALPNVEGYTAGADMDLWSINPVTGVFDRVGLARVSADGSTIETIEGGVLNSSWHFFAPPPPACDGPTSPDCGCEECPGTVPFTSEVSAQTGGLLETHDLVNYVSLGESRGVQLIYDSLRADARPIIRYPFSGGSTASSNLMVTANLTIQGKDFDYQLPGYAGDATGLSGGENFWKLPPGSGEFSVALQADLRDRASGRYDFTSMVGAHGSATVGNQTFFIGSSKEFHGKVVNINTVNSAFGSGWGIAGVQELVENTDGSVLLIDGNGSELIFEKGTQAGTYLSAPGDFSTLVKLADGHFQRTDKDQTVYNFDANNRLISVVDRRGQTTQHIYNATGQLVKMIDPANLETILTYNANGKVASIKDPANRSTLFEYDNSGNLTRITDPDGSARNFEYDDGHRMTAEVNQRGLREESFYNFAGRAVRAIRKDGTEVSLTPTDTVGLYRPEATSSPSTAPLVNAVKHPEAKYIDGNGNTQTVQLDGAGQVISSRDGVGQQATVDRNTKNLVTQSRDGRGNLTSYEYDAAGNVTKVTEVFNNPLDPDPALMRFGDRTTAYSSSVVDLQAVDVNSDGNVDLITLDEYSGRLNISTRSSDGTFTELNSYEMNGTGAAIAVGDLNNDGNLDLVVSTIDNATAKAKAQVLLNDGRGGFIFSGSIDDLGANSTNRQTVANSVSLADVTNDGQLDVVYRQADQLVVRTGRGDGEFSAPFNTNIQLDSFDDIQVGSGYGFDDQSLAIGDVNGDGAADVVVRQKAGFSVLLGNRSGRFTVGSTYLLPTPSPTGQPNLLGALTLADLNKDGKLDLLVSDVTHQSLLTFLSNGSGVFQNPTITTDMGKGAIIQTGDLNRDGFLDVVVAPQLGDDYRIYKPTVLMGAGDGTYVRKFSVDSTSTYRYASLAIADVNNDSGLDLITSNGSVSISLNARSDKQVQRSYTYDSVFNQLTSETDELGRKTLYEIDPFKGNILSATLVVGQLDTVSGETDDVVTRYTYMDSGLVDTITDGLGRVTDYDYNALGRLTQVIYAKGTLDEATERYEYDLAGNRTAMIDANGNRTTYEYDAMNRLVKETQADPDETGPLTSPVMTYKYDQVGDLIESTDARGFVTKSVYDQMDRLIQLIQPDPDGTGPLGQSITKIEYDRAGNQSALVDALGRRSEYRYDQRNRLVEVVNPDLTKVKMTYDLDNQVTGVRDENGHLTQQQYDTRGRLIKSIDALNLATVYGYDDADQLTTVVDAKAHITQYRYDDLGRRVQVIDARSKSTHMTYDKVGNLKSVTDPLLQINTFFYDNLNRLIRTEDALNQPTTYTYDRIGNQLSVTDALNRTTSFTYDRLNRLVSTKDALDQTSSVVYDAMDNIVATTDELNRTTTYTYDGWNRLVTTTDPLLHQMSRQYDAVGNLVTLRDGLENPTTYGYDVRDRLITVTDAEGGITRTTYDNVGNLKSVTDPVLKVMHYDYNERNERVKATDSLGHSITSTYDKVGNLATVTDGMQNKTTYGYDELNRQITQTDARGGITRMTYDDAGNLKSLTDSVQNTTSYDYSQRDELIRETNSLGKSRTYTYDQVGNLATQTDRNNRTTQFEYDKLDRLQNEQWKDAANATIRTLTYTYDKASRLTAASDVDSSYTYSYDQANRLTQVSNAGTTGVPTVLFNYGYDAADYLVSIQDTIAGQVRGTTTLTRDRLNRVTQIQQSGVGVANKRVDMNYDAASQLKGIKRYTNLAGTQLVAATEYNYDLAGRLQDLTHRKANNTTIAPYTLAYDAADRLTQVTSIDGPSIFDYDVTDQLTSADHTAQGDENYGYDLNGNRTNAGYQTGGNNQLLTDGTYNYTYDDEGNRISRTAIATGSRTEYSWDYRNRLTQVVEKNAGVVARSSSYVYDVYDRRIAKTVDLDGVGSQIATTERYVYDGAHIALVFDGAGNQLQRFLYGTQVDQVLVQENADGSLYWALSDHQGTVRDVVDGQGNMLNHIVYDSFGNVKSETNSGIDFRFGYTGREFDAETGLYYYRARYYDAQTGQFIGQDPLSFGAGDTNLYRYVSNSSVNFRDPSGMFSWKTLDDMRKRREATERAVKKAKQVGDEFMEGVEKAKKPGLANKTETLPMSIRKEFKKSNYPLWRDRLAELFGVTGPRHHIRQFMDYYFNDSDQVFKKPHKQGGKKDFNLADEGLLESIKQLSGIRMATNDFDVLINKIKLDGIERLQKSCYWGLSVKLTLPISGTRALNLTSENFPIGRTIFQASGTVTLIRDKRGISVYVEKKYTIDDRFDDVPDFDSSRDGLQELEGGIGYRIIGTWKTGFEEYVPNPGFVYSGSGYGRD